MKRLLSLVPAFLVVAGVLAGHFIWLPQREGAGGEKGLLRATVQTTKAVAPEVPGKVLNQRPADPELGKTWDFLQRLEKTPAAEFPAFWAELETLGNAGQNLTQEFSPQETLLAERWTELDPQAATAFFAGRGDLHPMVRTVFAVWSLADPDASLKALSDLSPDLRTTAAAGVFSAAADDPANLIAWGRRMTFLDGRELKQGDFNAVIPPEAIRRAFDLDPAACQELAGRLPPWFHERLEALAILKEASTSLPSALARIDAGGPGMDSAMHFFNEMLPLAESSPDKLLAITEHLTTKLGKGWLKSIGYTDLLPALTSLAKAAPDRVHGILAEAAAEDPGTDLFRTEAATAVFASDPRLALQIAPSGTSWLSDFMGGPTVFHGIAGTPQETLELVRTAPSSMMRDALMQDALATLGRESPEAAAAAWVASLPPGELENAARVTIERPDASAMDRELTRAVVSASTGGPDAASLERVRQLTKFAIQTDPSTVTGQLASWPEGPARDAAAQTAGKSWAYWSTSDALTWAESLPEELKATAVSGVLEVWAAAEPAAASEYIDAHQHDPQRDIPVSAFARGLAEVDPAASLQWAATVSDASLRRAALEEIAAGWIKKNPEAARAGLLTIPGLTAAERQQLASPAAPK